MAVRTDKEALTVCVLTAQTRVDLVREDLRKEGNSWAGIQSLGRQY